MKTIHGAGFNKAFHRPLIDFLSGQPLDKILQAGKRPPLRPFPDN